MFGLGQSTVCKIVLDTCEGIARHMMPKYICVPQNECLWDIIHGFQCQRGFLQAVGAIDGTHTYPATEGEWIQLLQSTIENVIILF